MLQIPLLPDEVTQNFHLKGPLASFPPNLSFSFFMIFKERDKEENIKPGFVQYLILTVILLTKLYIV